MQNIDFCKGLKIQVEKDTCFLSLSESLSEAYVCDEIGNQKQKDSCYGRMAYRNIDGDLCAKLDLSGKDRCYCSVSSKIENPAKKKEILDRMANDESKRKCATELLF